MRQFVIVLVGAIGIGIGIGVSQLFREGEQMVHQDSQIAAIESVNKEVGVADKEFFDVVKVIDGDTVSIRLNGETETLRLIGIDTPESGASTRECFGNEATERVRSTIGERVALEKDESQGERDKYGRLLVYLYSEEGTFINRQLILDGYATEYTYKKPYRYQKEFKAAEEEAKAAKKGMWELDVCLKGEKTSTKTTSFTMSQQETLVIPMMAQEPTSTSELSADSTPDPHNEPVQSEPKPEPTPLPEPSTHSSNYTCSSNTYNCSDFTTQAQAQSVYDQCGGVSNDIHKLDSNKDGEACESLP